MAGKQPRAVYSIDWLQVYCRVISRDKLTLAEGRDVYGRFSDIFGNHRHYKGAGATYYIKGYTQHFDVQYKARTVASISYLRVPPSGVPEWTATIRLANPVLYVSDWYFYLFDIADAYGLQPLRISRIDLACDLNYFIGGLLPSTFIRNYVCGGRRGYKRKGSNKWCVYAETIAGATAFQSIRWGSRASGVSVYMYNKSLELSQHDKPWIRELWLKNNLRSESVWRVEISISSTRHGLCELSTNILRPLMVDELAVEEDVRQYFLAFAGQYFSFTRWSDGKPIELLPKSNVQVRPRVLSLSAPSGRREAAIINYLTKLRNALFAWDGGDKYMLIDSIDDVLAVVNRLHFLKQGSVSTQKAVEDYWVDFIVELQELRRKSIFDTSTMRDAFSRYVARAVKSLPVFQMPTPRSVERKESILNELSKESQLEISFDEVINP